MNNIQLSHSIDNDATASFKDHFSANSASYLRYRPNYPTDLYEYLSDIAPERRIAWDCATGNGQAALMLADYFSEVFATDASSAQISEAGIRSNIMYAVTTAERSYLPNGSIDLVTVAQALHWFEHEKFFAEVHRVLKDQGVLAVWTYSLLAIEPALDGIIDEFHNGFLGDYWPSERQSVIEEYRDIDFPFTELQPPPFSMQAQWTLDELLGYFDTWSAVRLCKQRTGKDPLPELRQQLMPLWNHPGSEKTITWPLILRVFRKNTP